MVAWSRGGAGSVRAGGPASGTRTVWKCGVAPYSTYGRVDKFQQADSEDDWFSIIVSDNKRRLLARTRKGFEVRIDRRRPFRGALLAR